MNIYPDTSITLADTYVSAIMNNPKITPTTSITTLTKILITPLFL